MMINMNSYKKSLLIVLASIALTSGYIVSFATEVYATAVDSATSGEDTTDIEETQTEELPTILATADVTSVLIKNTKTSVELLATTGGDLTGTDGSFYLFELKPYETGIGERTDYMTVLGVGDVSYTFDLKKNTSDDRLYSSFVIAIYDGMKYIEVSSPHYITNPEIIASNTESYPYSMTKKGLQIELKMLDDAFELGVKHVSTNIAINQILGEGIDYTYDGKTYHFSKDVMEDYDATISALSGKDMIVTAIILNGYNTTYPQLMYADVVQKSTIFYYMFNASTKEGTDTIKAVAAFLAERYSGSNTNYGKVSNWIIGNEINNQQWNYIGDMDVNTYVDAYERGFRLFYTAIKSTNANNRIFYSIDYNWNNDINGTNKYGGKEIVDIFNASVKEKGNIDWGLAYHPYPAPMTDPEFWDDNTTGWFTDDYNTPVINFYNLNTLTDYFQQETLLSPTNTVRHIMLTEEGFSAYSASRGDVEELQAAAYAYSYYLVDSNPYIEAYILSRQVDAPSEVRQGLSFGLWTCSMDVGDDIIAVSKRKIWTVFKYIDKSKYTLENTDFAKSILGISKWQELITNFKWTSQENKR